MLEFGQDGVSGTRHSTKFTSPNPSKSQKLFTKVSSHLILPPSKRLNHGMRPRPQHTNWFGGSVHRTCNGIFHHVLIHACVSVLPFLPACPCPLNYNIEKHKKTYQSNVFIIIIVFEKKWCPNSNFCNPRSYFQTTCFRLLPPATTTCSNAFHDFNYGWH
jgi:hypothetical protein